MTTREPGTARAAAGEGGPIRVFEEVVTRKVASAQTGGAYALFEAALRPSKGVLPHIHHREDECFYVLEGTFEFTIAGRSHRSTRGDLHYVAKGTLHAYENVATTVGRILVWQTPGGLSERFYEELAKLEGSESLPGTDRIMRETTTTTAEIAARYGIEILLPGNPGQ